MKILMPIQTSISTPVIVPPLKGTGGADQQAQAFSLFTEQPPINDQELAEMPIDMSEQSLDESAMLVDQELIDLSDASHSNSPIVSNNSNFHSLSLSDTNHSVFPNVLNSSNYQAHSIASADVQPQTLVEKIDETEPSLLIKTDSNNDNAPKMSENLLMLGQFISSDVVTPLGAEKILTPSSRIDPLEYAMRVEQTPGRLFNSSSSLAYTAQQQIISSPLSPPLSHPLTRSGDGGEQQQARVRSASLGQMVTQNIRATQAVGLSLNEGIPAGDGSPFKSLMTNSSMLGNEPTVSQWRSDSLGQSPVQWGQKLLSMLSDRVELQLGQQVQKAQIRLDPPQLGSIDISIRVEQERTTVHLVASNQQVREAMQQTIEQLRQTLGTKLSSEIHVSVQADGSEQRQPRQQVNVATEQRVAGQWHQEELNTESEPTSTEPPKAWLNRLI